MTNLEFRRRQREKREAQARAGQTNVGLDPNIAKQIQQERSQPVQPTPTESALNVSLPSDLRNLTPKEVINRQSFARPSDIKTKSLYVTATPSVTSSVSTVKTTTGTTYGKVFGFVSKQKQKAEDITEQAEFIATGQAIDIGTKKRPTILERSGALGAATVGSFVAGTYGAGKQLLINPISAVKKGAVSTGVGILTTGALATEVLRTPQRKIYPSKKNIINTGKKKIGRKSVQ